jgi:hypothetical protein
VRKEAREGGEEGEAGDEVALLQEASPHEGDAVRARELMRESELEALSQSRAAVGDHVADGGSRSVFAAGAGVEGSGAAGSGLEHEGKVRDSVSRGSLKAKCVAAHENQSSTAISELSDSAPVRHALTSEQQQQRFEQEVAAASAAAASAAATAARAVPATTRREEEEEEGFIAMKEQQRGGEGESGGGGGGG